MATLFALVQFSMAHALTETVPSPVNHEIYSAFNDFNSRIRDGRIDKGTARSELPGRLAAIRTDYYRRDGRDYSPAEWVFPVAGYSAKAIGPGKNHGFVRGGYDFFSGNRHGGHPAYDIFIRDRTAMTTVPVPLCRLFP
jgi:hypothetical protein